MTTSTPLSSEFELSPSAINLHDLLEILPHVRRQSARLDEQVIEAHPEDGGGPFHVFVTRRMLLFTLDPRPIGRRDPDPLGESVHADPFRNPLRPNACTKTH